MRRQIPSTAVMASSTTNPTAMVRAISDRLSRLNLAGSITAAVASRETGITALAIRVARRSRRNRKITATTRAMVISRVISTSCTEARMVTVRSATTFISMPMGTAARRAGNAAFTASTVLITLAPGSRKISTPTTGLGVRCS